MTFVHMLSLYPYYGASFQSLPWKLELGELQRWTDAWADAQTYGRMTKGKTGVGVYKVYR